MQDASIHMILRGKKSAGTRPRKTLMRVLLLVEGREMVYVIERRSYCDLHRDRARNQRSHRTGALSMRPL